jgi:hypothetical protein
LVRQIFHGPPLVNFVMNLSQRRLEIWFLKQDPEAVFSSHAPSAILGKLANGAIQYVVEVLLWMSYPNIRT